MTELIITNGDVVADSLAAVRPKSEILPWRDALHEGPVPAVLPQELRALRADWLADGAVNTRADVLASLEARDRLIADHGRFERIELWFEHDLYDQLQLVQVLDMLTSAGRREDLHLIQAPRHLGPVAPQDLRQFEGLCLPVSARMTEAASRVWQAFTSDTPVAFAAARPGPLPGFPFLGHAIRRMLQELPGPDGLGRTERQILYSINRGVTRSGPLFARVLNMEEAAFLGDWSFFRILTGLQFSDVPLICGLTEPFDPAVFEDDTRRKAFITANVALSEAGAGVLAGAQDRAQHGTIDLWVGGTHASGDNLWRWDDEAGRLVAPA